jgi:tetraacyldisaccharide 4'-kinase
MKPLDKRLWHNKLRSIAYQKVYFSNIEPLPIAPIYNFPDRETPYFSQQVIIVSGIGNPRPFIREAETRYTVVDKVIFPDHHRFTAADISAIADQAQDADIIITTQKDWARLSDYDLPDVIKQKLCVQPIEVKFLHQTENTFNQIILDYVTKDSTNSRMD